MSGFDLPIRIAGDGVCTPRPTGRARTIATAAALAYCALCTPSRAQQATPVSSLHLTWTNFVGADVAGSGDGRVRLGGRLDGYGQLVGSDLRLWDDLVINAHAEFVYGRNVTAAGAGVLLPPTITLTLPASNKEDVDLSLNVTQRLGPASLTVGKINMVDLAARTPLVGGGGREGFEHGAFAAPISLLTPPDIFGALLSFPASKASVTLGVWDVTSAMNKSGLEHPFDKGVAGMVQVTVPARIAGRQGFHTFTVEANDKVGLDLADIPDLILPPGSDTVIGRKRGAWFLKYALQQYIWQDPADPRRGWGVFGHAGVWDGNPSPLRWTMTLGLVSNAPFASRPADRAGVGYFRLSPSGALENGLSPLVRLDDEQGVEAFYEFAVGPQLRLTLDGQVVEPALKAADTAVFTGARLHVAF